jgi:histidinol-phosphate aminotransferase
MEKFKINKWINNINRIFIPRPTKESNKRFDMAERIYDFPKPLYNKFLKTLKQEDFIAYPSYAEYESLKEKIANYNKLKSTNVFLSTGSGACIKALLEVTMNPGYNVVSPTPSYPMYGVYGNILGGEHITVPYTSKNFSLDDLINAVNENTRLVVVSNPFSPIGDYKDVNQLKKVCEYLKEKNIIFLIDEAYVDFGPGTVLSLINEYDNVIISRTFSKAFGAAGIRVGYLLGNDKLIKLITKVQLTYPLSSTSVKFASFLLDNVSEVEKYTKDSKRDRDILCDLLESKGYDVIRSHTNSIHFHESNGDNSKTSNRLLLHGLAFKSGNMKTGTPVKVPGDDRGTWIRLSIGPGIHKIIGELL